MYKKKAYLEGLFFLYIYFYMNVKRNEILNIGLVLFLARYQNEGTLRFKTFFLVFFLFELNGWSIGIFDGLYLLMAFWLLGIIKDRRRE